MDNRRIRTRSWASTGCALLFAGQGRNWSRWDASPHGSPKVSSKTYRSGRVRARATRPCGSSRPGRRPCARRSPPPGPHPVQKLRAREHPPRHSRSRLASSRRCWLRRRCRWRRRRPASSTVVTTLAAPSVISSLALLWFYDWPHARPALRAAWPRRAYSPRPLSRTAASLLDHGRGAGSAEAQSQAEAYAWAS